jgi:GTP-binding protein HflX
MVAGHGSLMGGIGTRGPGEQQLEVDRRLARQRITDLKREIARIEARKRREVSARAANYTVALVGYTNAGKSTLLNALTGSDVLVEDKLFSTLDTKTRVWRLPNRQRVLLSDTVGFIRNLPHHLVASFQATLEEAREADLQLHVVDASHPEAGAQIAAVRSVLETLGCAGTAAIGVLNKADRVEDALSLRVLERAFPEAVACSAKTGAGLDALGAAVERAIAGRFVEMDLAIPAGDGRTLAALARYGQILSRAYDDGTARVRARVSVREVKKFERFRAGAAPGGADAPPGEGGRFRPPRRR